MPLPLTELHSLVIQTIPIHRKNLIEDLENILSVKNKPTDKKIYTQYLRVILKHIPQRELKNKDPEWMWICQEVFSDSFNK